MLYENRTDDVILNWHLTKLCPCSLFVPMLRNSVPFVQNEIKWNDCIETMHSVRSICKFRKKWLSLLMSKSGSRFGCDDNAPFIEIFLAFSLWRIYTVCSLCILKVLHITRFMFKAQRSNDAAAAAAAHQWLVIRLVFKINSTEYERKRCA